VRRNYGASSSFSGSTKRLNEQVASDQDFQMISISVDRRESSIFQAQFAISKR
jgi:hypothetical protein